MAALVGLVDSSTAESGPGSPAGAISRGATAADEASPAAATWTISGQIGFRRFICLFIHLEVLAWVFCGCFIVTVEKCPFKGVICFLEWVI